MILGREPRKITRRALASGCARKRLITKAERYRMAGAQRIQKGARGTRGQSERTKLKPCSHPPHCRQRAGTAVRGHCACQEPQIHMPSCWRR
eukprot:3223813-Pyramimonas_sp.AAC.1